MLTRLKVSGFKNLVDVDVRFGPFTCIAGGNGAGKSNLFDAIEFLNALARMNLNEAALSIRDAESHSKNIRALFHQYGEVYSDRISFEVEMRVPTKIIDNFGKAVCLEDDLIRYSLILALQSTNNKPLTNDLQIIHEELFFISDDHLSKEKVFSLDYDNGLERLGYTMLNAAFTVSPLRAANLEIKSWSTIQLEPTAMRRPNQFLDPTHISQSGDFLASTLYELEQQNVARSNPPGQVYQRVANQLADLIDGIVGLDVERNDAAELLTIMVKNRAGTSHSARALSDGSLRFLAMAILAQDTQANRLLCLEEPENGIHPNKIPAMLDLLTRMGVDLEAPIDPIDNPLRQVIISTQSPAVVCQVPDDSLLFAQVSEVVMPDGRITLGTQFSPMPDTWRDQYPETPPPISTGALMEFLHPVLPTPEQPTPFRRIVDRPEIRQFWRPEPKDETE